LRRARLLFEERAEVMRSRLHESAPRGARTRALAALAAALGTSLAGGTAHASKGAAMLALRVALIAACTSLVGVGASQLAWSRRATPIAAAAEPAVVDKVAAAEPPRRAPRRAGPSRLKVESSSLAPLATDPHRVA